MSNRAQRRAAKHKGKRQGETYADVLAKKRMIKEAIDRSVHDQSVAIEADVKSQRMMWMSVIALNRAFGFGGKRCMDYFKALDEVASEAEEMREKHGGLYAKTKLMEAHNLAPYCLNRCEECVDFRGWCKQDSDKCHGFNPAEVII